MLIEISLLIAGLVALVWGAELLVDGSTKLALGLGISTFVVGLTVVAFGTSAPELFVSVNAALKGSADVAIGNIIGSNTFNILVVIGLAGFVNPFKVSRAVYSREMPIMISVVGLFWYLSHDGVISRTSGIILFFLLLVYILMNAYIAKSKKLNIHDYAEEIEIKVVSKFKCIFLLVVGLALMVIGSEFIVANATILAREIGVSELVIGITLVAVGTSLPEVATTFIAAKNGEPELAVGNAIGSNIFNVLCVIGITSAIQPLKVNPVSLTLDFPFMFFACAVALPLMLVRKQIRRIEGGLMLLAYFAYVFILVKGI
ncbi:MAG: calcium/sodium antiporter [Bdellovibrionota bacterium]